MSTRRERRSITFEQKPNDVELVKAAEAKRERRRWRKDTIEKLQKLKEAR